MASKPAFSVSLWERLSGPLLTLIAAAIIELLNQMLFKVPNPAAILLMAVVFSAFSGGLAAGVISAAIAWAYLVYYYSNPGLLFNFTEENRQHIILWAISMPIMVAMVGFLKHRMERALGAISAANAALKEQISERERSQAELRRSAEQYQNSEARLRALFAAMRDVILVLDAHGRYLEIVPTNPALLYKPADDLIGKAIHDVFPAPQADLFVDHIRRALDTRQTIDVDYSLEINGQKVWFDGTLSPINKDSVMWVARDITKRKQAEEALGEAHAKLAAWVNELERHNHEVTLLGKMGDLLHSCLTLEEAYGVAAQSAQRLFPAESGALYVLNASRNLVDVVAAWGDAPAGARAFAPDECVALRRGRMHVGEDSQAGLVCQHLGQLRPASYLCVPLIAQGEALGVLHLRSDSKGLGQADPQRKRLSEPQLQLGITVAEQISLALSNLNLRETLRLQSIRDPLTGLFNRRYLEESLDREVHRAARRGTPLGVIMLDLDHFKQFNDSFGHAAGDTLLRELGAFLQAHVRREDIACRYGGEEFALILPEASLANTQRRAEQLRNDIKHLSVEHRRQPLGAVTLSLGVAAFPEHGSTAESLLNAADSALYRAKAAGRDQVVIA